MRPISNLGADQARNDSPSSASNGLSNLNESRSRAQCDEKVDRKQQESNWTSNNYPTTKGICDCTKSMLHQLGSKMPPQEAVPFPPPRFARHPRSETVAPDSPLSSTMPSTVETPTLFYPLKNFKPDSFEGILPGAWSCLCVVQSRPRPVLLFVDSAAGSGERRVFDKPPIAEKRYKTLLPRGWFRVENFHGRIWYWHLRSGIATYRHPAYNPRVKYRDGNLDIPPDPEGTEDSKDWDVNQYPHGMTNGFLDPDGAECQIATDIFHNKEHAMDLYLNRTPTSKEDSEAEEKLIARRTSFYFQPCHQRRSFRVSGDDPEFPRVSKGMFF
ncbi:MAG: hypothetical protein M1837_007559 [Sclerophora amabilis]|nr:MAG: hypothetical protein M1837_007559 [Sclerophora amabilis]